MVICTKNSSFKITLSKHLINRNRTFSQFYQTLNCDFQNRDSKTLSLKSLFLKTLFFKQLSQTDPYLDVKTQDAQCKIFSYCYCWNLFCYNKYSLWFKNNMFLIFWKPLVIIFLEDFSLIFPNSLKGFLHKNLVSYLLYCY